MVKFIEKIKKFLEKIEEESYRESWIYVNIKSGERFNKIFEESERKKYNNDRNISG